MNVGRIVEIQSFERSCRIQNMYEENVELIVPSEVYVEGRDAGLFVLRLPNSVTRESRVQS